jgi:hypothetical protein
MTTLIQRELNLAIEQESRLILAFPIKGARLA